jgi:hypothetical protein
VLGDDSSSSDRAATCESLIGVQEKKREETADVAWHGKNRAASYLRSCSVKGKISAAKIRYQDLPCRSRKRFMSIGRFVDLVAIGLVGFGFCPPATRDLGL